VIQPPGGVSRQRVLDSAARAGFYWFQLATNSAFHDIPWKGIPRKTPRETTMSMKLTQYIRPDCFLPELPEKSREDALRRIVHAAAEKGYIKEEAGIFAKLMERENIQSTAVGNGIAIPHCFTDEVPDLIITVARSSAGLEFDSFDGKPTQVVFLLMGNRQEHSLHLKALARIARLIKSTSFIEKIIASSTVEEMVRAFEQEEAKI
jgi:PTS system nitrogen regulatory IIA component